MALGALLGADQHHGLGDVALSATLEKRTTLHELLLVLGSLIERFLRTTALKSSRPLFGMGPREGLADRAHR